MRAILLSLSLLGAPSAAADEALFRIVPYAGLRAGGSLEDATDGAGRDLEESAALALALELRHGPDTWWQLWYSRQGSSVVVAAGRLDVDIEYLHVGGTAPINSEGRVQSYVSGGLGATRLSPGTSGLDDDTRFSFSLGLGLAVPLSARIALRLEARGYLTLMDTDTALFCRSDGGDGFCLIAARSSSLFQAELLAGVSFAF